MRLIVRFFRRLIISALILCIIWTGGHFWFISQIPREASTDTSNTDAIVVLTGGSKRIDYGLSLLKQGKAKRLFISGVNEDSTRLAACICIIFLITQAI